MTDRYLCTRCGFPIQVGSENWSGEFVLHSNPEACAELLRALADQADAATRAVLEDARERRERIAAAIVALAAEHDEGTDCGRKLRAAVEEALR